MSMRHVLVVVTVAWFALACSRDTTPEPPPPQQATVTIAEQARQLAREAREPVENPPNVLVLAVDNIRADRMSAYGGPNQTSPVLDELAERGTRFAHAVSQAPYSPHSWSSILSSLHVSSMSVRQRVRDGMPRHAGLEPYHTTLAEAMQAAGYSTGAVIQGWFTEAFGLQQGFEFVSFRRQPVRDVVDASIDWLRDWSNGSDSRPFFLFSYSLDVHAPFMRDQPATAHVFGGDPDGFRFDGEQMSAITAGDFVPTPLDVANAQTLYDEGIYWTDRELGRLLTAIDELGLAETTLIVVVSDHGEEFGEHGHWGHGLTNYGEIVDVPLIFYDPRVEGGNVVETPVMNIDVAPTILDLVGAQIPAQAEGLSLAPSVSGNVQAEFVGRPIFSEGARNGFVGSVQVGDFKLLIDRRRRRLLFDLAEDPEEREVVTDRYPEVAASLEQLLFLRKRAGAAQQLLLSLQMPVILDDLALPRIDLGGIFVPRSDTTLSDDDIEQLRALGYLR